METKFFTYNQNNSGGYFVEDHKLGLCEYVILEAETAKQAWEKLESIIDASEENAWNYCGCCGERWWNSEDDEDGTDTPTIFGTPIEDKEKSMFREIAYIHYIDGTFKKHEFKEKTI
jgi:hypothetical protein